MRGFWGSLGFVCFFLFASIHANASWNCEPEQWVGEPGFRGGLFRGTLRTTCIIQSLGGGGFANLEQHFVWTATVNSVTKIHAGPIRGSAYGLPSSYYDVTTDVREPRSSMRMRQEVYIATDLNTRLVYHLRSKYVHATGDAEAVKLLDVYMEFTPLANRPGYYKVVFQNEVHLNLPIYARLAPGEVRSRLRSAFLDKEQQIIPVLRYKL